MTSSRAGTAGSKHGSWRRPAVLALLLVVVGLCLLFPPADGQQSADAENPTTSPTAGPADRARGERAEHAHGEHDQEDHEPHELAETELELVDDLWRPAAEGFASDLVTPGQNWHHRVSRWTIPHVSQLLAYTSQHNIRADQLLSVEALEVGNYGVTALATYESGTRLVIELQVEPENGDYQVASYYEVDPVR